MFWDLAELMKKALDENNKILKRNSFFSNRKIRSEEDSNKSYIKEVNKLLKKKYDISEILYAKNKALSPKEVVIAIKQFPIEESGSFNQSIDNYISNVGLEIKSIFASNSDRVISREFYSSSPFEGFKAQSNSGVIFHKPAGLWYSCNDDWKRWVEYEMPQWWDSYEYKYKININSSSVLQINNVDDFEKFEKLFISEKRPSAINWGKVSTYFDGIEICPYQWDKRMSSDWYYTWDVASGCIWGSGAFESVEEIPNFKDF